MKRSSFFLPETDREALRARSARTGVPAAELLRRALNEYLTREARSPAIANATAVGSTNTCKENRHGR